MLNPLILPGNLFSPLPVMMFFLLAVSCNIKPDKNITLMAETAQAPPMVKGYKDVNGLQMYYEIHGAGNPLVLIHGGGSTIETSFGRVIPALSRHRKVIAVELQGHGRTPDIDRPETFEQDADDVAGLLKSLNIKTADFLGFSNGGSTAMQVAIRHPGLVKKLIVGSAFFKREGLPAGFWDFMARGTLNDMPQELKDAYLQVAPNKNDLVKMFEKDKNRMVTFKDWNGKVLQSIMAPVLVVAADRDVVSPEHTVEMYRLFKTAQLAIIPGVHGEYIGEITTLKNGGGNPVLILPLIEKFLNDQP